jgi:hypothetical protein
VELLFENLFGWLISLAHDRLGPLGGWCMAIILFGGMGGFIWWLLR